ncbi:MAG TPA: DUF1549 and DUF1553 domain-containing protein [Planctomycetota bacterium]|nr:DUF1549 and DUF1553 domain-containing protein [Planctomycetota bacterium]
MSMKSIRRWTASLGILLFASAPLVAEDVLPKKLSVEPPQIVLRDPDQNIELVVTAEMSDGTLRDATLSAHYSLDPGASEIALIHNGRVTPSASGKGILSIRYESAPGKAGAEIRIPISIELPPAERAINFTNDIIPILTKAGCNSGGCHGKATGQNGFSLSLLGFEPEHDYDALVKEGRGRRLFPAAPEQSLFLLKAIGQPSHGGGQRIAEDSREYRMLRRWIEQGMPKGKPSDPTVDRIEVFPRERILIGTGEQQLRVVATYSDGSTQDVTRQAEYKSQQPDILKVDPSGAAYTLERTGEGAIMVRYMGLVDVAKITVPFNRNVPASAYEGFHPRNYVDELMLKKWKKLGIAPSPRSTDDVFIRRACLDVMGTLPSPEEVSAFLDDRSPDKRDRLVDRILERPEYAEYWSCLWGDLLRNKREGEEQKRGTFAFAAWIRACFAENMPYDQFVREILTAQGEVGDNPAVNWYRHVRNQIHLVNDTSQLFLGTRVSCANCHHHPYEKLSQDDYWGFAAFFQRVGKKQGDVPADQAVFVQKSGETSQPRSGKRMKPKGLGGPEYEYVAGEDPRKQLVDWMTTPENAYFSKAIANRMFAGLMGLGLVNSVDDMRVTNPPSNPELLEALAKDIASHHFDLKALIRSILKSETYGLSSDPTPFNATDRQNFARYHTKRLSAEVLLDAVSSVTGSQEKFPGLPLGTRAIELPDQAVSSYFLTAFGRSGRETPCECERSYAPNLAQILHLMNSPEIQGKIASEKGTVAQLVGAKKSNEEIVEALYLRGFSRRPTASESKDASDLIAKAANRKAAIEDFVWLILNSKEFLFNH